MIKGFNRRVVVMKNTGSKLFDEAFFVMKENINIGKRDKGAVEAAREIIRDIEAENPSRKAKKRLNHLLLFLFFLLGLIIGLLL